jgi:DNA-binding SARP family transcriptional activator
MQLEVYLLGEFRVLRDEQETIDWPRAAPKRLFKMLAIAPGHALPVDDVAAAFWPNDWRDQVRQRLHHLVYLLRTSLVGKRQNVGRVVEIRDGMVRLLGSPPKGARPLGVPSDERVDLWIDAVHFASSLEAAMGAPHPIWEPLQRALDLFKGPLLPGDVGDDAMHVRREQLQRSYVQGLHALSTRLRDAGFARQAMQALERAVRTSPTDELAHRVLMSLYAEQGQLEHVERQYAECKKLVDA